MSIVETRKLTKRFGQHAAVDGIDLVAREREFLVLLGPSGCGKSTLMRLIAGIEVPTSGQVLLDGRDVTEWAPRDRNIAMVFQSYALYPHLTVRRNIAFPLKTKRVPKQKIAERIDRAAQMFKIGHLLDRKPSQLSGGERQRVALARAMVREPLLFMLDEPLSNLDAKLRTSARDEIQQLQRRMGTTTIYVTHDQVEAMALGDRVAVLCDGRIRQIGTPGEVYRRPADTFVATFVGSPAMNLVELDGSTLGFRPEEFLPRPLLAADEETIRFRFRVSRIENLGSGRLLYGMLGAPYPEIRVISELPAMVTAPFAEGEEYEFGVRQARLSRFERSTGQRIETHSTQPIGGDTESKGAVRAMS